MKNSEEDEGFEENIGFGENIGFERGQKYANILNLIQFIINPRYMFKKIVKMGQQINYQLSYFKKEGNAQRGQKA